ncbi:MAG TPA: plasmid replication protein, CyRepA1 family, partial [Rhodoferax sp.]
MKVSILTAADNGSTWSNQTILNPDDLAALLAQGKFIAAARKQPDGESITDKFGQADLLMVRIDLARLPLETALGHDFTQRHASVAAHQLTDDGGTLLLAFELTAPTLKADFYRRLLAGLEALYAGSRHHTDEKQAYGLTAGCTTTVLGNKLDASSQVILDKLGREAMQQRAGKWEGAYLRSRVTLDRSDIFTLATGEEVALQELPNEFEIACPIHIDHKATAVVRWFADGTPGVQCDHCQRTYAAPNTQRDYDFDHFDRILKQLDPTCREDVDIGGVIVEDRPITFLNTRYLPALEIRGADGYLISDAGNGPLEIRRGVTYVKSPKGSGKTEALVPFVEQCKKQHWRVLLIGHRRALLQSMAARLGLDPYFVVEDSATPVRNPSADCLTFADDGDSLTGPPVAAEDDADKPAKYHRLEPTRAYAVCLDSLMGLQPEKDEHKYPVIIIDESEQVFAHLVGETLADSRRAVFARLSHYLKNAAIVVLLDADLNRVTMDAMCAVGRNDTPVRFVVNEYKAEKREIRMYGSSAQLTAELLRRVDDGEKSYVATNSLAMAENLRQLLLQRFPDKVVLVVSSKTSGQKSTQELLADIPSRFRRNLDVLIASPAIGTGVDITFKDQHGEDECIVKNVFGFFSRNIITHLDIDQQLMRVRHPGQVHV